MILDLARPFAPRLPLGCLLGIGLFACGGNTPTSPPPPNSDGEEQTTADACASRHCNTTDTPDLPDATVKPVPDATVKPVPDAAVKPVPDAPVDTNPGEAAGDSDPRTLPGVDTSDLSASELETFFTYANSFAAPCATEAVSVATCVKEARPCRACLFAARFLASFVKKGLSDAKVRTAYAYRFAEDKMATIDLADTPFLGPERAVVTIVEFADFQCPYCKTADRPLRDVANRHEGKVALYFKNFPLSFHTYAASAARASVAAIAQNKFWPMHDGLFEKAPNLSDDDIRTVAFGLRLDMDRFESDWGAESTQARVTRDIEQGNALGIRGTPTVYINGRWLEWSTFDLDVDLGPWVEMEIEMLGASQARSP